MAFALPFFNMEMLARVMPTRWASSVTLIFAPGQHHVQIYNQHGRPPQMVRSASSFISAACKISTDRA